VTLVQSSRDVSGLAFADEFRLLQKRHGGFRWVSAVSGGHAGADHYPGRIDGPMLKVSVPNLLDSIFCICGPGPMIDSAYHTLLQLGVPEPQIRYERFEAAVASVGAQQADAAAAAAPAGGAPAARSVVTFSRTGKTCEGRHSHTLLDIAEDSGVEIPSVCRAGICGTCRTKVIEGDVQFESHALDDHETAEGYVLACVARPLSDCTVEA
jgi:ring-1,2-phenylacetyl-CoA epoxidase subunit PaaE